MKKLISTIGKKLVLPLFAVGVLALGSSSMNTSNYGIQKNIFRELGVPKMFWNYEKNECASVKFISNEKAIGVKTYNVNNDRILDVRELYILEKNEKGEFDFGSTKPFQYFFNANQNREFEDRETLFDVKQNGLSGDEKWFYQIISEGETALTIEEMFNRI
jgi:hypothetical protein